MESDVLDGTMLTLAQTVGHRYQMFDDAGSKCKRDNGKWPSALFSPSLSLSC